MNKVLTIGIVLLIVGIVTATGVLFLFPYQPDQPPQADDTGSTQQGVQEVVNANNQFAFELFSEFQEDPKYKDGNIFFSPYSISVALTMTYEGARGQTAEEMQSVFHIPRDTNLRRPNFAAIYNDINKKDKSYKLSTGNALWAQQDYKFLGEYLSTVEKYYGGKAANVDFLREREKSRQTINTFIEEQTNNKIKDLIPEGVIDDRTRLVLTNAIYFKGTWVLQFDPKDTRDEDFTTNAKQTVKVPMMSLTGDDAEFAYAGTDEIQILEMPYDGEDLSMLIILPKENNLGSIESLSSEKLSEWRNMLNKQRVNIYVPKFKFETKYFMVETLSNMGMPIAFTNAADFSGMDGTKNLLFQDVIHQAFVEVNEEGTEAAAATAVVIIEITSVPMIPTFRADHPFIFIIQEKETGNILFLGRVADPRG
ncbi:MAG: serpin family protein [Candidatus Aenigmarchaeota archaeon]|nr:serpin family protein [Candidatus Aenigmarchaeota archaeon]